MHAKIIQLNYKKCASNNNTAVHMLRHEGKSSILLRKGQKRTKTYKKERNFLPVLKRALSFMQLLHA